MGILEGIQSDLKKNIDKKYKIDSIRFFKDGLRPGEIYGVRTPIVRKIGTKYWKQIKNKDKSEIFSLCEQLLSLKISELLTLAFQFALNCRKNFEKNDLDLFEKWLEKYVDDWSKCDDICIRPLGFLVLDFPELLPRVFAWTKSKNMWLRRAAAVCLIPSLRRGKYLENAFRTADALISDNEDLVQKGYGWMLKEGSNKFPREVFEYVMANKNKMTRTALRYSIEKLPEKMEEEAMK